MIGAGAHWRPVLIWIMTFQPGPAAVGGSLAEPAAGRSRWGWVGGLTMVAVYSQLQLYAKSTTWAWHGYHYGVILMQLPMFLLVGLLAPLVSYRRRDALLLLLPLWNLVVLCRIGSRLTRMSHRDWPHRPDEPGRAGQAGPVPAASR